MSATGSAKMALSKEQAKHESYNRATFAGNWECSNIVSPLELAMAGFYYTGVSQECLTSPTANRPCYATAEAPDEKSKTSGAASKLCFPPARGFTVAAECDVELTTADDVRRDRAMKSESRMFAGCSPCVGVFNCVKSLVAGYFPLPSEQVCNAVVRTARVLFGSSATSMQPVLHCNLQRLAQLATSSCQSSFELELLRLASMFNWTHLGKLSALRYSSAGFHVKAAVGSTLLGDCVACFSCGYTIGKFTIDVHPMALHREKCKQRCRFIAESLSSGNIPIASEKPSATDCLSSLGLQPVSPQAARVLGSYTEADLAAVASGSSLIRVPNATSRPFADVQTAADSVPAANDFELLKHESYRLRTFYSVWASYERIVNARELARSGFFYAGPADRVQCAYCKRSLRNWEPGDSVDQLHAQHFNYCRFVRGRDVGNVPIPLWPRLATQKADVNAVGTTEKENGMRSYFCDGTVFDCRADCDPSVEHVQLFPGCPFLRLETSHDFVQQQRVHDEPAFSDRGESASVDRQFNQVGLGPALSDLSASTSTDCTHQVHEERACEVANSHAHLLHLETPSSDLSASVSVASGVCQVHDHEPPSSSRSEGVSANSHTYDPCDEPVPSTLTTNIPAVCRACQVRDEPASGSLRTSFALDSREVTARMDSHKVRILRNMGYSSYLIRVVIQKRLATCESDHETSEQILNDIFRADDEKHRASSA